MPMVLVQYLASRLRRPQRRGQLIFPRKVSKPVLAAAYPDGDSDFTPCKAQTDIKCRRGICGPPFPTSVFVSAFVGLWQLGRQLLCCDLLVILLVREIWQATYSCGAETCAKSRSWCQWRLEDDMVWKRCNTSRQSTSRREGQG
jgi:hypothetical protein